MEPEDIQQLDPSDPSLVRAAIGSVKQTDLPFTQLGEGDNRVRSYIWLIVVVHSQQTQPLEKTCASLTLGRETTGCAE
jgi:hypothetical protein